MPDEHAYTAHDDGDGPDLIASWAREHRNGERTVVTVQVVGDVFVAEATDLDADETYPSERIAVTRTDSEAIARAEAWMEHHEKGVNPGGNGLGNLLGGGGETA